MFPVKQSGFLTQSNDKIRTLLSHTWETKIGLDSNSTDKNTNKQNWTIDRQIERIEEMIKYEYQVLKYV